jgi:hypothetical protein
LNIKQLTNLEATMVERAFDILFLAALAAPVLAVVAGALLLMVPLNRTARRPMVAKQAAAHI